MARFLSKSLASWVVIGVFALPPLAWAVPCGTTSLSSYMASGFSCTIGDLEFSGFSFSTNFTASAFRTANFPSDILVTPLTTSGEVGFTFSNLNLSFSGFLSNTTSAIDFHVLALAGTITDASVQVLDFNTSPPGGRVTAFFEDTFATIFGLGGLLGGADNGAIASATFAGVTAFDADSGAAAIVDGFAGGSSSVDSYRVLLSTTAAPSPAQVPEPGTLWLVGMVLAGLAFARRNYATRAEGRLPIG